MIKMVIVLDVLNHKKVDILCILNIIFIERNLINMYLSYNHHKAISGQND